MGSPVSKDEAVVERLLQSILSLRETNYDKTALEGLIVWARAKNLLPSAQATFEVSIWDAMKAQLGEKITKRFDEPARYFTLWQLLTETEQFLKTERQVTALAYAALASSETERKESESFYQLLFIMPTIMLPASFRVQASARPPASGPNSSSSSAPENSKVQDVRKASASCAFPCGELSTTPPAPSPSRESRTDGAPPGPPWPGAAAAANPSASRCRHCHCEPRARRRSPVHERDRRCRDPASS